MCHRSCFRLPYDNVLETFTRDEKYGTISSLVEDTIQQNSTVAAFITSVRGTGFDVHPLLQQVYYELNFAGYLSALGTQRPHENKTKSNSSNDPYSVSIFYSAGTHTLNQRLWSSKLCIGKEFGTVAFCAV